MSSTQSYVYGYIQTLSNFDDYNNEVLKGYTFDEVYPFSNIFCAPKKMYRGSIISFAGIYKDLGNIDESDWKEWVAKFEKMLQSLYSFSASVHLKDEDNGFLKQYEYVCENGLDDQVVPQKRKWVKTECGKGGSEIGESKVI